MNPTENTRADEHGRGHLMDEPDIGSGEKTPGELETEEHIRQIRPQPAAETATKAEPPPKT
ncbi:hypothetical protein [Pseudoduganella violacea]|uniref:Uncharacterized protein n=1 Tax=Pseudoduganella violacea TaxID=1715466 RepID=A0A7W5B8Q1_9BURK|nr:hypothetical protein [Pseudoduganella violacea]MBB3118466.1 hypothetical protein [Pseudoduganella violacea]